MSKTFHGMGCFVFILIQGEKGILPSEKATLCLINKYYQELKVVTTFFVVNLVLLSSPNQLLDEE